MSTRRRLMMQSGGGGGDFYLKCNEDIGFVLPKFNLPLLWEVRCLAFSPNQFVDATWLCGNGITNEWGNTQGIRTTTRGTNAICWTERGSGWYNYRKFPNYDWCFMRKYPYNTGWLFSVNNSSIGAQTQTNGTYNWRVCSGKDWIWAYFQILSHETWSDEGKLEYDFIPDDNDGVLGFFDRIGGSFHAGNYSKINASELPIIPIL